MKCIVCGIARQGKLPSYLESQPSFHAFPKREEMRKKWLYAIGQKPDRVIDSVIDKVCSNHFTVESYHLSSKKSKILLRTAFPSLNLDFDLVKRQKLGHDLYGNLQQSLTTSSLAVLSDLHSYSKKRQIPTEESKHGKAKEIGVLDKLGVTDEVKTMIEVCTEPLYTHKFIYITPSLAAVYKNPSTQIESSALASEDPLLIGQDSSFKPKISSSSSFETEDELEELFKPKPPLEEEKFIVFGSHLLMLFKLCHICHDPVVDIQKSVSGTGLHIKTTCQNGHIFSWHSQPTKGLNYWGNLLLGAAMLFSGNLPHQFLNVLRTLKVAVFTDRTYFNYQRKLFPIIKDTWKAEQCSLFDILKGHKLTLTGDGHINSPGSLVKFGYYTMVEPSSKKILHMEMVQSTAEVSSSNAMEANGFKQCVRFLIEAGMNIAAVVTDCQVSIVKIVEDEYNDIKHYFDCRHIAQSIKKQICTLAKNKDFKMIMPWLPAIMNHLYWVASTSAEGSKTDKWKSLINHITNVHEHEGTFKACVHGPLVCDEYIWLDAASDLYYELSKIVNRSTLMPAIEKLSPIDQTHLLKNFHSVINTFVPKRVHFGYDSLQARLTIAILHFNENNSKAAVFEDREEWYKILYPKLKAGEQVAKTVLPPTTYGYVDKLMLATFEHFQRDETIIGMEYFSSKI